MYVCVRFVSLTFETVSSAATTSSLSLVYDDASCGRFETHIHMHTHTQTAKESASIDYHERHVHEAVHLAKSHADGSDDADVLQIGGLCKFRQRVFLRDENNRLLNNAP